MIHCKLSKPIQLASRTYTNTSILESTLIMIVINKLFDICKETQRLNFKDSI